MTPVKVDQVAFETQTGTMLKNCSIECHVVGWGDTEKAIKISLWYPERQVSNRSTRGSFFVHMVGVSNYR